MLFLTVLSVNVVFGALTSPFAGYTRQTIVTHTGGGASDLYDHKTVTVVVSNPRLARPVRRTTIIAAF